MTTVLVVGDVHLADRPPSIRTETYVEDILAKVIECVQVANERSVGALVFAGDVFHIKAASRNSHALVQRTGKILQKAQMPVLIVPGNHDLQSDRLDSLSKQPLGTLAKMVGIELLIGPHPTLPLFGLPYLQNWSDLPVWMRKYREWADNAKAENFDFYPLMVTHAPIFPKGEEPPYDFIEAEQWADLMVNGDCYYGHIHDPHGDYQPKVPGSFKPDEPNCVWLCNHGAISRGSIHEKTLKREPAITIWNSEIPPSRFERIPLQSVRPIEAVFRLREKEDADEKVSRVEDFLAQVGQTAFDGLSLEEVTAQARERGLRPETVSLIEELMEAV